MRVLMTLVLAAMMASCGNDPLGSGGSGASVDREGWPEVIRVGLIPTEGGADTQERFHPIRDHLRTELDWPVELQTASDYQGVITAMSNDQIEFAWFGAKSYVEAAKRADAEALLLELNDKGERGYRSILIVPADSEIRSLADAKGKRFAFTDPNSTSGMVVPQIDIIDLTGMPAEEYFGEVTFSGAHQTSILEVASGKVDIAATNDLDMAKVMLEGRVRPDQVRVIHESDLIPGAPWAGRRELPASLKKAFVDAIMKLNDEPSIKERLQNGGYSPVTDEEYDMVRQMSDYLESQNAGG
ncbi:MAG: phosphonate ABC transporter substrate-binding protein [Phycisphaerales bacterium]|nr:phosphonate ABC transporter substrate-binding protein [Phycisphaerales bacterium]